MMDKAKAYDEALEKARQDRDAYQKELDKTDKNSQLANILKAGISALEMVFPQLKESDDERIRKDIIDHFESIKAQALYDNQEESDNIISSCNEKIAYLEKQKEQKPIEPRCPQFVFDDILALECAMGIAYRKGNEPELYEALRSLHSRLSDVIDTQKEQESTPNTYGCLNCTKWEECKKGLTPCSGHRLKIVDQKPTDDKAFEEWIDSWFKEHKEKAYPQITMDEKEFKNFCRGIRNMYQQKSDWSEEDEEIIYSLRSFLIQAEQSGRYGSIQIAQIEQCLNWLKSVHPIKQDWNEEDEEIWFALITFFKTYLQKYPPACKDEKIQANRILKWLNTTIKSFRLHHRYKPSEEQVHAIVEALKYLPNNKDEWMILDNLADTLMKLM